MKKGMLREARVINGQQVMVMVCPPSQRRAASSIQQPKYQKLNRGSFWIGLNSGQIEMDSRREGDS
jgi:hypothetical protein